MTDTLLQGAEPISAASPAKGKLFIQTHGCQMNEYDSAKMADVLAASDGLELTTNVEEADVILINTCSIREKAQEKVFSQLGRWKSLKSGGKPVVIPNTGGLRKLRFAPPSWRSGKRGAMRVVYGHLPAAELVYFFVAYGKNEQGDMTPAEKKLARATMQRIRQAVREGGA